MFADMWMLDVVVTLVSSGKTPFIIPGRRSNLNSRKNNIFFSTLFSL